MRALFLMILMLFPASAGAAEETVPVGADLVAELLACLPDSWGGWVTLVVTICAAVAALWSRPSEDASLLVRILYAIVNAVGFNAGKAQNADDAAAKARKIRV